MSAPSEKLKTARELVARSNGWTQHVFCGWPDGRSTQNIMRVDDSASCYCAEGALHAAGVNLFGDCPIELSLLEKATNAGRSRIPEWNDAPGRTQAEVVAAFDRAIELAEAAP